MYSWVCFHFPHTDFTTQESDSELSDAPDDLDLTTNELLQAPVSMTSSGGGNNADVPLEGH
jgi:hypothetical protein